MSEIDLTEATAEIVASYVSANTVAAAELPSLIQTVYKSLKTLGEPVQEAAPEVSKPTPAQVRKSITPDALISFEDGKPYKTLKRHLATHGLTLDEYKAKWGLPRDYPSTAPSYSERRSAMAKSMAWALVGAVGAARPKQLSRAPRPRLRERPPRAAGQARKRSRRGRPHGRTAPRPLPRSPSKRPERVGGASARSHLKNDVRRFLFRLPRADRI